MGKSENYVMKAVEDLCARYRVPCFRIHSRIIDVIDKRKQSGFRPFRIGTWKDDLGNTHNGGMADLLLMPRFDVNYLFSDLHCESGPNEVTIPLWVETKAKTAQSSEQIKFQQFVEAAGAKYLLVRGSADPLIAWFREYGVIA